MAVSVAFEQRELLRTISDKLDALTEIQDQLSPINAIRKDVELIKAKFVEHTDNSTHITYSLKTKRKTMICKQFIRSDLYKTLCSTGIAK